MEKKQAEKILSRIIFLMGSGVRRGIVNFIYSRGEVSFEQIRKKFNLNCGVLSPHLEKLVNARIICQAAKNKPYRLTEIGNAVIPLLNLFYADCLEKIIKIKI